MRWITLDERGWGGVLEAAALGVLVVLVVLIPEIVGDPYHAVPIAGAYCTAAAFVGAVVGLVLLATGSVTIRLALRCQP